MGANVSSTNVVNISDLRLLAKKRLPQMVFDYIDSGADREQTLSQNCTAFKEIYFRPRCAVATPSCDLNISVLDQEFKLPFILAPVGSSRMFYPKGEVVAAREAGIAGTGYTLSTLSGCRLEEVKQATNCPAWYQLYLLGGRDVAMQTIERAKSAGFSAIVVTIDTPISGLRERDVRNGTKQLLSRNPIQMLPYIPQMLIKPCWLTQWLGDGGLMSFPNVELESGPMGYTEIGPALEESVVTWEDLNWIREAWGGKIIVKGIHIGEDARKAIDLGVDAVVVSNHGARQLDSVAPTIQVLPEVVKAVNGEIDVLIDGGIRRGGDVVKALCLGAKGVLISRAYAYGLAAGGGPGVAKAIEIIKTDILRTMKLLGCDSVKKLDRSFVTIPPSWA
ncbi:alpha-hydroxy acid oxidase [Prochlorococcus marinus]|uniref:L-lactate dehydrogenase (FMN-dependent)-like alpha-hydroxy acid dehydrogenases n=1 Tax=Prochlorococcus marinus (strain MIT 9211) TaxID=93059 RepID=A9BCT8_PROM4|nr:alpha-hydroxy acid oxidase [Prochlorococcus marinus]ABX09650.1 L-lactate dehydrogenase (FMN-dependent)-like alpha-hydroxy acid dehydrogenases [Prochlorococcus marinus str. MIT 9211]